MKTQIDTLVRDIHTNLVRPLPADSQLAGILTALGGDGFSVAVSLRSILVRWTEDVALSVDDRAYASQQLDALPDF